MANELQLFTNRSELTAHVNQEDKDSFDNAVLCELGGGLLRFTEATFLGVDPDRIYAQPNEREPEGRGPHFDVYANYVDQEHRWIGIYNLAGRTTVKTTVLAPELADIYFKTFPEPTDVAFEARRHFAEIALATPMAKIYTGRLDPGVGLLLPQRAEGPHIIHDIIPDDIQDPGKFIKLVVPSGEKEAMKKMSDGGYKPVDQLISEGLGAVPRPTAPPTRAKLRPPAISTRRREFGRRPCNLD